jgi:hypothetical protein
MGMFSKEPRYEDVGEAEMTAVSRARIKTRRPDVKSDPAPDERNRRASEGNIMRNHRWYTHYRRTVVVYRLPSEARRSLAELLHAELRSACRDALAGGVDLDALIADLRDRAVRLRAGAAEPSVARPARHVATPPPPDGG